MSRMVKLVVILLLLGATAGTNIFARSACAWDCNTYYDSKPSWFQSYGAACGFHGAGCRECVSGGAGGYTVCVDSPQYPVCTDYPDYNGY